jgi:hypothetical protein
MKRIDPDVFIRSRKPYEVVVGVLAGKYREKPRAFRKVMKKDFGDCQKQKRTFKIYGRYKFFRWFI